jgi:hypothetical protein
MNTSAPKKPPGRPRGATKGTPINIRLPKHHHEYLDFLVNKKGRLGGSINEAAVLILTRELDRLEQEGYHTKDFSKD